MVKYNLKTDHDNNQLLSIEMNSTLLKYLIYYIQKYCIGLQDHNLAQFE